jgi:hypothetical protein
MAVYDLVNVWGAGRSGSREDGYSPAVQYGTRQSMKKAHVCRGTYRTDRQAGGKQVTLGTGSRGTDRTAVDKQSGLVAFAYSIGQC